MDSIFQVIPQNLYLQETCRKIFQKAWLDELIFTNGSGRHQCAYVGAMPI